MEEAEVDKEEARRQEPEQTSGDGVTLPFFGVPTQAPEGEEAPGRVPSFLDSVQDTTPAAAEIAEAAGPDPLSSHPPATQETEATPENKPEEQPSLPIPKQKPLSPALPEYIPAEVTLENLGFFTPSSKRVKDIYTKEKVLGQKVNPDGTRRTIKAKISANHELGLPITSDQDYFHAFEKICYELAAKDGRLPVPVPVPTKKLVRYAGKLVNKRVLKEAREWFERMTLTGIKGGIYRKKHADYDDAFVGTLFSQVLLRGERIKNGKAAETNLVWPAPWYLSNYFYRHLRPRDHNFYRRLRKPIAKSLAPLLEMGWYASGGEPYRKRYSALCEEFLLARHTRLGRVRQQLDPAHRELEKEKLLGSWEYRTITDDKDKDWVIFWHPGEKFFEDQQARRERRQLAEQIKERPKKLPLSPALECLWQDVLAVCGETENKNYPQQLFQQYPEALIRMALSETRQADLEHRITKTRWAYFVDTIKRLASYRSMSGHIGETFNDGSSSVG